MVYRNSVYIKLKAVGLRRGVGTRHRFDIGQVRRRVRGCARR